MPSENITKQMVETMIDRGSLGLVDPNDHN